MKPEIIIMLTNNDITVKNAEEVFESCKDLPAKKWGFKDVGLPKDEMIKLAYECGFDYLTGALPFDSVFEYAKEHNLKYSPFCGKVGGSPVELTGSIDEIVSSAKECIEKGADGVDLTAYRYADGDPIELTKAIVDAIGADKVCIAGSVGNEERMNQMKDAGVAEYTMGSALFNANFVEGGTFRENLEYVLNYLSK